MIDPSAIEAEQQLPARDHDLELALLIALFVGWHGTILKIIHTIATQVLGLPFDTPLDQAAIQQMVLKAQAAAAALDAATRKAVAERIAEGRALGLSPEEIANGTKDFPGINGLFTITWAHRPQTVAETELQRAQLEATIQRFQTLGRGLLSGWDVRDGDYDSVCAGRNGTIAPAHNPPTLAHPHCRLVISPRLSP